jgi:hypothetical protein
MTVGGVIPNVQLPESFPGDALELAGQTINAATTMIGRAAAVRIIGRS